MEPAVERYTRFEDLPSELIDIKEITTGLFSENWEENFESLTQLRSFLKFNYEELKHYWNYFRPRILQLASSIRSQLSKNALMFLVELLADKREDFDPADILSFLLAKSANEKSFLKFEINSAIENACQNYPSLSNCQRSMEQSFSKSANIAKLALKCLDSMVGKLEKDEQFHVLQGLAEGKRQEHNLIAKKIVVELELTWDEFTSRVNGLQEKVQKWILKLNEKKEQQKVSLKDIIRMKKVNTGNEVVNDS